MVNRGALTPSLKLVEVRILTSLHDTEKWAEDLLPLLNSRQILGLVGEMGSGKTHFVKALAKAMGLSEGQANSPTFALHQEYLVSSNPKSQSNSQTNSQTQSQVKTFHHWDLYRLESEDEIESSGFWDLFYEDSMVMAIEWIDRIPASLLPLHYSYWRLEWEIQPDGSRKVSLYQR